MSEASIRIAAILSLAIPTVEVGGLSRWAMMTRRIAGYLDNPVRRHLFRAGHAHAGVWIIFRSGRTPLRRSASPVRRLENVVRLEFAIAPILMPLGFFLSIVRSDSDKPNGVLWLTILGGLALAVATVTLGIGLLLI